MISLPALTIMYRDTGACLEINTLLKSIDIMIGFIN